MKNICVLILFFLYSDAFSKAIRADRVLENVQKKYKNSKDFQADFKQVINYRGMNRQGISSGSVVFKKPNKIKWIQKEPDRSHYISNGKLMWLYMLEDEQVFVNKNLQEVVDKIGLLFMSTGKDLLAKYKISVVQSVIVDGEESDEKNKKSTKLIKKEMSSLVKGKEVHFEVTPLGEDNFTNAFIKVDRDNLIISRVTIFDLAKNRTTIDLKNVKFDIGAKDSLFEFKPPENVEVFSNQF